MGVDLEIIRDYCLAKAGTSESFPFDEHTLVFKLMGKMFAIIPLERLPLQINLKCDPEEAIDLRDRYPESILPGYHMNKQHWNTVILESDLNESLIKKLVDHSYELIKSKLPKKVLAELALLEKE